MNPLHILEGWRNVILPPEEFRELIQSATAERRAICEGCPFHSKNHKTIRIDDHCTDCGCPLKAKTACLACDCPKGFWGSIDVTLKPEL